MQLSHRGFSKCFRKKMLLLLLFVKFVKAGQETYWSVSLSYVNLPEMGRMLTSELLVEISNSPAPCKALEKMKEQRLEKCDGVMTPVTVDFLYQTMGRHCLKSGYIKILKTTWEGKKKE